MATFYIEQFGCRATQADGAALQKQLLARGCTPAAQARDADIVVVNTCTVTAAADAQARDAIRKMHVANPTTRVIVTGCYAQRAPEELSQLPGVAWVVGNSHKPQIPELVGALPENRSFAAADGFVSAESLLVAGGSPESAPEKILRGDIFEQKSLLSAPVFAEENHTRPTLKIQDGCDSRCSFCVIPFVRGRSRSLPPEMVLHEIRGLTERGYREIVLSGINLGAYGRDLFPRVEFETLLRRVVDETSIERLRISSIEPMDVTRDLIELFASTSRLAQHFHMPLQSGCDRILAAMHRWYRAEHYARRVEMIHELLPNAAIGADVIAGFPGETEEEHAATVAFIEKLPFSYLHVFSYSKRPGTKAASFSNHVPGAIIKRRARELRVLSHRKANAFRNSQVGRELRVLTLHPSENSEDHPTPALSTNYLRLLLDETFPANQWLQVTASETVGDHLLGRVL
ncbi:MAG TPA: tRNA (N(6)-L-threonylcarbamoyladenosine(37)-C(2))-methylthiotransferase MtaB [Candidatus Limnocylindrales bacterium]|nr:tRNA (N(6)-L-threonylcarbamoyladenosine(37)-C(2))-methylthiotransferase MtaB [Candidatus Limnocylindrales bacterium]